MAKGIYLIGFENSRKDGTGVLFNWILSNGTRSTKIDGDRKYYDHMIPADALHKSDQSPSTTLAAFVASPSLIRMGHYSGISEIMGQGWRRRK